MNDPRIARFENLTKTVADAIGKNAPDHILPYFNELAELSVQTLREDGRETHSDIYEILKRTYYALMHEHAKDVGDTARIKPETRDLLIEFRALVRIFFFATQ